MKAAALIIGYLVAGFVVWWTVCFAVCMAGMVAGFARARLARKTRRRPPPMPTA